LLRTVRNPGKLQEFAKEVNCSVVDIFRFARYKFWRKNGKKVTRILKKAEISEPTCPPIPMEVLKKIDTFLLKKRIDWGDWKFHLEYRLHLNKSSSEEDLRLVFSILSSILPINERHLKKLIKEGIDFKRGTFTNGNSLEERRYYDLSILPLNLLIGKPILSYFCHRKTI